MYLKNYTTSNNNLIASPVNHIIPIDLQIDQKREIEKEETATISITPRQYQIDCIEAIFSWRARGKNRLLISIATGGGKTVIFAYLIKKMCVRTLLLCHTKEQQYQAKEKLEIIAPELTIGIVNKDHKEFDRKVVISSIQAAKSPATMSKLIEQGFDLIIIDESHHAATDDTRRLIEALGCFNSNSTQLLLGFTATPFRTDGKGLGEVFEVIAYEKNTKELIDEGYLVKPIGLKIATDIDFSKVKTKDGDFQAVSLSQVMDTPEMNRLIVESYIKNANGLKTICFGTNVQHAGNLACEFNKYGIRAKLIHGKMTSKERDAILEEYKNGNFQVLLNCAILTEGFDSPETECIIIARPTQSLGLYQQMVGRGLRKFPNKNKCIVIDFNDKNHSICNSATLLRDAEEELKDNTISTNKKLSKPLDREINQELQSAHLEHDLYGESFYWDKDGRTYTLKGKDNISLIVTPQNGKYYRVIFIKPEEPRVIIAKNLDFSYAFSIAQDFAKKYKKDVFILKDKDAYWRNLNKLGYKNSFDQLTRGQASDWIDHLLKQ